MTPASPAETPAGRDSPPASDRASPLGLFVEIMTGWAAAQTHLFATSLGMVRNFHRIGSIPPSSDEGTRAARAQERQSVVEIERDGRVGIDLKFGSITFRKEDAGSFAVALVDVIVSGRNDSGTRVQMETKVPVDPSVDSVLVVTETSRAHIVATLRAAADTLDAISAETLLFHGAETGKADG